MIIATDILPECYVDTNIVTTMLHVCGIQVNACHCKGCGTVAVSMQSDKLTDTFAVGIVDNDKRQPTYFTKEFLSLGQSAHLELLRHRELRHYLIRVTPAMDGFILDVAKECRVSPAEFELPETLNEFKKLTKSVTAKEDQNLTRLFKALKDHKEMILLRDCLSYLYTNKYSVNEDSLTAMFE